MSHTPTSSGPGGNALAPNQSAAQEKKPTLAGVRVRQRKGQAKATAKFEPESFRDSFLLHLALLPSPLTTDVLVAKLVQAGTTLEYLKYNEQFFELLFVGGLLQPGGAYLDDKRSPVYIVKADEAVAVEGAGETGGETGWKDGVKGMVEVLKRVIQRYKYLQKPLEEDFLPNLLGYLGKWDVTARAKLAEAVALLVLELGASPRCLQSLAKDHVVKDGVALSFLAPFFRTYLSKQNVEHLGSTLRRSGLKDLLLVFPVQTRDRAHLEEYFKKEGLQPIVDWHAKLASLEVREQTTAEVERMINDDETNEQIIEFLKTQQADKPAAEADLCEWIWQGIMRSFDWTTRTEQLDQAVIQHISARTPILEVFCNGAKAQIGLINAIQVYCYTDTRIIKSFAQIIKALYNADVVTDQAIIYWHQKGAKPQGKQHFLKATDAMVQFLSEQDSDEDE